MARIRPIRCQSIGCSVYACKEVRGDHEQVIGVYCAKHAESIWRIQRDMEAEAKRAADEAFEARTREIKRDYFGIEC